ncbi:hypothetical protein HPP92_009149 [Vanilla planifolia]|uniref:DUF3511 domain protein n=1 Tax=Vanilla planifolia TaxID=51239 RepID=A0A835RBU5_VANPL|nr:hypothetical protein HPP92_009149 [Vanilla planifolia]
MEGFRSRSYTDGRSQIEPYGLYGPPRPSYDLGRYGSSYSQKGTKLRKVKSARRWLEDPEFQRKKRVAGYKVYSVEGKLKASFRKSIRWLKERYNHVVYGW